MTKEKFYFLHDLIKGDIKTRNTQFREAISTEGKFAMKNNIKCMYLRLGNCLCIMNGVHV